MTRFELRPLTPADHTWLAQFMQTHWGAETVVAHDQIYYPTQLPGFVAWEAEQVCGVITYQLAQPDCEIVTLDSLRPELGIGTALIDRVKEVARQAQCARVWLITTNDNLHALRFYQKRGFELVTVHRHAVARARLLKPSIPLIGHNGIPLRDEIELELLIP